MGLRRLLRFGLRGDQRFPYASRLTDTPQESAALALKSGCDLNRGAVYLHVMSAYNQGLVSEDDIDRAVTHLMMTRMRLGMFDQHTEFDEIPYEVNDCASITVWP